MQHRLSCQCGHLRGHLVHPEQSTHLMCYCKDCQAFARYLGKAADMLDAQNGSHVIVSHPQQIVFDSGADALACMSLSERGMLRWYATCCNTAIGNTSRNPAMAFVGMSSACLADPAVSIEHAFGPVRMRSCTDSAKGEVAGSGLAALPVMAGFMVKLLTARVSGSYRRTPFFKPGSRTPVVAPTVLDQQARARLDTV
jgi:hypothetical protein